MLEFETSSAQGVSVKLNESRSGFFELKQDVCVIKGRVVRGLSKRKGDLCPGLGLHRVGRRGRVPVSACHSKRGAAEGRTSLGQEGQEN